jgi:hypothetical protein
MPENTQKRHENRRFPSLTDFKIAKKAGFHSKVFNKIYPKMFLEEYIILPFFVTQGIVELYLFKVSQAIYNQAI